MCRRTDDIKLDELLIGRPVKKEPQLVDFLIHFAAHQMVDVAEQYVLPEMGNAVFLIRLIEGTGFDVQRQAEAVGALIRIMIDIYVIVCCPFFLHIFPFNAYISIKIVSNSP